MDLPNGNFDQIYESDVNVLGGDEE